MVLALDAASGAELWRRQLRAPIRAAPTVIDGKVLVPTADSQLFALDAATGEVLWQHAGLFEQAGILGGASPAAADGIVVAAYASGEVVALSLASRPAAVERDRAAAAAHAGDRRHHRHRRRSR